MNKNRQYEKFRQILQKEFLSRIKRNPSYSLRAYAKSLEINDSTLSKILNQQMPVTKKRFEHLSKRIPMDLNDDFFAMNDKQFLDLDIQKLRMLSNWYYPAILELTKTNDFENNSKSIAYRLGLSIHEVKMAISDLVDLKLLLEDGEGNLSCTENYIWDGDLNEEVRLAHRNIQRQFLRKADETMFSVAPNLKENASLTVACDPDLTSEVKKKIEKFQQELDEFIMNNNKQVKEVYQLNINFFPLTNPKEKK